MNRETKRRINKKYKPKQIISVADLLQKSTKYSPPKSIADNDKIEIDLTKVQARANYAKMNEAYKAFVEESVGKTFTAKVESENLISLVENPRWLFWSGDLNVIEHAPVAEDGKEKQ